MPGFLGEYEMAMDAKGRFLMPAGFRKQLPEGEEDARFVVKRGAGQYLELYTLSEWEKLTMKLSKLNDFNPKVQLLKRLMLNGAGMVELDTAGRLLLPKSLQAYAALTKELVFSAGLNKVEIWDKSTYHLHIQQESTQMAQLSAEVFGSDFLDPFQ